MALYSTTPDGCDIGNSCESLHQDMESNFVSEVCEMIVNSLKVKYYDQRIVKSLLETALKNIQYRDGLLEQYLNSQLDIIIRRFKREFELDDSVRTDYSHATHAKFSSMIKALKKKYENDN